MDRSWIQLTDRNSIEYENGVTDFIEFARNNSEPGTDTILCPCVRCNNGNELIFDLVEDHLIIFGMVKGYTKWTRHGEDVEFSSDEYVEGLGSDCNSEFEEENEDEEVNDVFEMLSDMHKGKGLDEHSREGKKFNRMVEEAETELYPGCKKFSKLSFTVHLLHLKVTNHWSNSSFTDLLSILKKAFPDGESLPESYYEAKKIIRDVGHTYEKIHACRNNCILYRNENKDADSCPNCKIPRYKEEGNEGRKIPHKVLRYFPLKSRLQRLFTCETTAKNMRWHKEERSDNGVLRHPADSEVWKDFDVKHHTFSADCRNVRLGLASDGFNPFGDENSYSIWPVFIVPYNLPPWLCVKENYLFMSLLIPGPRAPGIDIDVFLQPLVEELQELWVPGIETYDAYSGQKFQLRVALLWTINDLPAYGDLSGWSTKGKLACPSCNEDASHKYLKHWRATCYVGHRRFLPTNHYLRNNKEFNGKNERRLRPRYFSGDDVYEQLKKVAQPKFGKVDENGKKRKRTSTFLNWKKKSIFFDLPYWKTLKLRHNLDVMHIEKNICDNILGTLLDIDGKTKDSYKSRLDLEDMGIRKDLHLRVVDGITYLPEASYVFTPDESKVFCEYLESVKYPDGYASNTTRFVNLDDCLLKGLKSHDCHIILQQLLPIGLRGFLDKDVRKPLTELGLFFRALTSKTLKIDVLDRLEKDIVLILCKLEKIFPPSFFTIMMHLTIHLAREARLAGPIQFRWMFKFERFMHKLKKYIRNAARPEGSIAEGYIDNECLSFFSMYLDKIENKCTSSDRNEDGCDKPQGEVLSIFARNFRNLGGKVYDELSDLDLEKARLYVFNNCDEVQQIQELYKLEVEAQSTSSVEPYSIIDFEEWFLNHVSKLYKKKPSAKTKQLMCLARGPDQRVSHYTGCVINGIRFHTKNRELRLKTQNSGVVVKGCYKGKTIEYYGIIKDMIELSYLGDNRVLLFKCDWWNVGNNRTGIKKDEFEFVSINITKTWYKDEPFALANQARQVFYLKDTKLGKNWNIVQKVQPRSTYDIPKIDKDIIEFEVHQEDEMQEFDQVLGPEDEEDKVYGDNEYMSDTEDGTNIVEEDYETDGENDLTSESDEEENYDLIDDDTEGDDY